MLIDPVDPDSLRRVLVVKLRHHGDVLLTSPVFSVLKQRAPHLEIDALVYRDTAEMLTLHPAIAQVHGIDRHWKRLGLSGQLRAEWALFSALRERSYDLIVHLTEHHRGAWLTRLLAPRFSVGRRMPHRGRFWRNSFSHLYAHLERGNLRHTVESHLDALRRIGIHPRDDDEKRLVLVAGAEADAFIARELESRGLGAGQPFIHLHPTSRWLFKCWPEEKMTALIAGLQAEGHRIVLSAAPDAAEMALLRRIVAPLGTPPLDLSGRLSLKQLAALVARARLFIGMDSVPMHIAAAMQTPSVALFGPSGEREWGAWMAPRRIITSSHDCRPCGNAGCGDGRISDCLTAIPVAQVLDAVHELLAAA